MQTKEIVTGEEQHIDDGNTTPRCCCLTDEEEHIDYSNTKVPNCCWRCWCAPCSVVCGRVHGDCRWGEEGKDVNRCSCSRCIACICATKLCFIYTVLVFELCECVKGSRCCRRCDWRYGLFPGGVVVPKDKASEENHANGTPASKETTYAFMF